MKKLFIFIFLLLLSTKLFSSEKSYTIDKTFLRIGVDFQYKPFSFINSNSRLSGFDIDLINNIARKIDKPVKYIEVNTRNRYNLLLNDKIDILATSIKDEFQDNESLIFSDSYFDDSQIFLVNKEKEIFSLDSLENKSIGVIKNSFYFYNLEKHFEGKLFVQFRSYPQLYSALNLKNIDAITSSFWWAKYQTRFNDKFEILNIPISNISYHFALKKENEELKELLNNLINVTKETGEYKDIYDNWFNYIK